MRKSINIHRYIRPVVIPMECPRPAKVSREQLNEIQALEKRFGLILVAYEKIPMYKKLSPGELSRIQALEKEAGAILVAYEA